MSKRNHFIASAAAVLIVAGGFFALSGSTHGGVLAGQIWNAPSALTTATTESSSAPASGSATEIRLLAVGDMFFDRYIRQVGEQHGPDFVFSCIDPLLQSADFVVGNLEGPITDHASVSLGSTMGSPENYQFTFPTSTAALLAAHLIRVANIGNNHIGNAGREGIASTEQALTGAGVGYFGGLAGDERVVRIDRNAIKISFVSYNEFGGDAADAVAKEIAEEHASGRVVIVYAHWGEEYASTTALMHANAQLFAANGADVIIGSHPHVVLSHETIGHTLVYYSLGNFIFDQYWNEEVTHGLTVLLHISNGKITAEEHPIVLKTDGRTCPVE